MATGRMRFELNRSELERWSKSHELGELLREQVAEPVRDTCEATAPRNTGDYADAFDTVAGEGSAYVVNRDFKAGWIEKGTGAPGPTPAHQTMHNALRANGLRTEPGGGGD